MCNFTNTLKEKALEDEHLLTPSFTWIKMCKGPDDEVKCRDSQEEEQQELEPDDPLHPSQVDPQQAQQDSQGDPAHRPDVAEAQDICDGLRESSDVHGTCNALKDRAV